MNNLEILYEDNHIIVVVKDAGVLSQSDGTFDIDLLTLVKKYIKDKYNKPGNVYVGLVHRLDRNVGGVMVFAKTSKAAKRLNESIKNHEFKKTYLAYVKGVFEKKEEKLTNYIKKEEKLRKAIITNNKDDKKAELYYKVIKEINNNSLVRINLITGRFHQIRCQLSNINHPIIGDLKYGNIRSNNFYLFAYKLSFIHPVTKEIMEFEKIPNWEVFKNETIVY